MVVSENESIQSKRTLSNRSLSRSADTEEKVSPLRLWLWLLIAASLLGVVNAEALSETEKIESLIRAVERMPARFVRNGTEYDAKQAADHLRFKLNKAGGRIKTAEDFITYCGTQSWMSGEKYKIKFADGRVIESEVYLREKLRELEAGVP